MNFHRGQEGILDIVGVEAKEVKNCDIIQSIVGRVVKCRGGEMADAHGLGPCVRKDLQVQVLSPAHVLPVYFA